MCETRIENAAKSVDGVLSADWDKETQMIDVKFDSDKLPGCCKYERIKEGTEE
jgi:copper chaperone CopZ